MATRNIAGTVSDRHGIPLKHALRLDLDALETAVPADDDLVLVFIDGVLSLSLVSDIGGSSSGPVEIFDILSGNSILTVSQPDLAAADVTLTVVQANIDHDALSGFVADEHVPHSGVTLTAGVGLAGGGTIASSRTFDIDWTELVEDTNPDESADLIATYDVSAAAHKKVKIVNIDHDGLTNGTGNKHIDHTAVTLTAGVGLAGGGDISSNRTFDIDITELSEDTSPDEAADFLITYDTSAGAHKKVKPDNIQPNVTSASGTLPILHGGTGQTTQTAAFNALDPLTAKGDIITHDGTDSVKQAVGTNGYVLTADSTVTNGLKWALPGDGNSAWTTITKLANQDRSSNTTPSDDDTLFFTVAASSVYLIRMFTRYVSASATPDIKWNFHNTGTTTSISIFNFRQLATTGPTNGQDYNVIDATTSDPIGTTQNQVRWYQGVLVVGASGGVFSWQWSQDTTSVTATTVQAGSFIEYIKVS